MFFYEEALLIKLKQAEIEENAKHAWKWNKEFTNMTRKQSSCDCTTTIQTECC